MSSPSGSQEAVGGQGPLACLTTSAPAPRWSLLDRSASQGWDRRVPLKPHFPIRHQRNSSRTKWVGRGGLRTLRTEAGLPVHTGLPSRGQPPPSLWHLLRRVHQGKQPRAHWTSRLGGMPPAPTQVLSWQPWKAGPSPHVPPCCFLIPWASGKAVPHRSWGGALGSPCTPFKVLCSRQLLGSWLDGSSLVLH